MAFKFTLLIHYSTDDYSVGTGVGSKVENIQKEVEETAAVQKENFEKLNERQKQSLNEIFTKYEENKVELALDFKYKGGFLGMEKSEKFTMDSIILADGSFVYTLVHAKDSPFRLQPRPRSLISVKGQITGKKLKSPIPFQNPYVLFLPAAPACLGPYELPLAQREEEN